MRLVWLFLKRSVAGFIADDALSLAAAIAFFTITSLAPVLVIAVAIAGLVFGEDAARGAMVGQLTGLVGDSSAELLQGMLASVANRSSGWMAFGIGLITALIAASGVFGEMQSSLNRILKADLSGGSVRRLVRARLVSLALVAALGLLLIISLIVSAVIAAVGDEMEGYLPGSKQLVSLGNLGASLVLLALLFGAIYKVLPDRDLRWRDVLVGSIVTAGLFTAGKAVIALYLARSSVASAYGAAGTLMVLLLWIYYSALIFLLGAEFTKTFADWRSDRKLSRAQALAELRARSAAQKS